MEMLRDRLHKMTGKVPVLYLSVIKQHQMSYVTFGVYALTNILTDTKKQIT